MRWNNRIGLDRYNQQVALLLKVLPLLEERKEFALKGGTAINLFIRDMPRLSVDIDLTYLPLESREDSLKGITKGLNIIANRLVTVVPQSRIRCKSGPIEGTLSAIIIETFQAVVTIEVNQLLRGAVFGCQSATLCPSAQEAYQTDIRVQILSSNDIYGGKICAALDRQHPRDLFDIKILFDNEGLSAAIRQSFIAYLVSHNRPMHELLSPNLLDIFSTFRNEFQGMSRIYVSHEELISARAQLIMTLRRDIT